MMKKILLVSLVAMLAMVGCGQKAGEKIMEKAIESAAAADGEKVDVDIDSSGGTMSMTVKGADGKDHKLDMKAEGDSGKVSMTMKGVDGKERKMDVKAEGDGDNFKMSMQTEDGTINMTGGKDAQIPADFPKDVPQYPGMKLDMVQTLGGQGMFMVMAETKDPIDKVAEFFKAQCSKQGWAEEMQMSQGEMRLLSYSKEDRGLNVTLIVEEGVTKISLNTANK